MVVVVVQVVVVGAQEVVENVMNAAHAILFQAHLPSSLRKALIFAAE